LAAELLALATIWAVSRFCFLFCDRLAAAGQRGNGIL
jgi:hypothetical protein